MDELLFYVPPIVCGGSVLVFVFCMHYFLHNMSFLVFSIIFTRKRALVTLLLLSFGYHVTVNVLWLYLTVPWAGLQCLIVVFPYHTHLLLGLYMGFRDTGYLPFYGILPVLLPGIWDTMFNNYGDMCHFIRDTYLFTSMDMGK